MKFIDGKKIANAILDDLKKSIFLLKKKGIIPGLGILVVGEDPASHTYVSIKMKTAEALGIYVKKIALSSSSSYVQTSQALKRLQKNKNIHGIIIQIPLPKHLELDQVTPLVPQEKDIDCFHPENLSRFFTGRQIPLLPPTAEAVMRCIRSTGLALGGKRVLVIGRGFFGRQIAAHCTNNGGVVTLVSSHYKSLSKLTKTVDIIVSAVGREGIIRGSMVHSATIIIDVGISKNTEGRIVGDVDSTSMKKKKVYITPVPGGVGPITVALLMENVVKAAALTLKKK
ncbi:MAG: bifunctional 5,10-methylenetetrahydrofolate dehydrogenase/5,10-methenyltetrahydrofolate cyclohydrolase [bacterium]|nr:bifunctional 5,10-methylenetetrahydrofolate dehydrogenase/5,10-methenyltetrahydrofolate cyclohydrolase [bacterium]